MKLKLKATIKKVAGYWDPPEPPEPDDTVDGLLTFYTCDDDNKPRTFKNAEEVYDYYDRKNWPKGWDDDEPDWGSEDIPKNWSVELIDTDDPRWKPSDGYEVEILIWGDYYENSGDNSEIEWNYDEADIYRISPHIREDFLRRLRR